LYTKKGFFYFDDFKLMVETHKGHYEEVRIAGGDFEADSLMQGWGFRQDYSGYHLGHDTLHPFSGKRSCRVDGSQFDGYPYGENPNAGKYANVNGIRLYYETYGQGPPLLLLHGNSVSIRSFDLQIPEFAKSYTVIAVDTRGHGKSTEDGKTYTYDLFADDMKAFLDHLGLDSVHVVGWSDGGNTGLIMAMKYPAKVRSLVCMGANVFIDHSVVKWWVFPVLRYQQRQIRSDTSSYALNRKRLIHMLLNEPRHHFEDLGSIGCPVLVMAGRKDIIKDQHTLDIARHIPGATLMIVPHEGHEYPWDNPQGFNKAVLEFLSRY
jgi:pimeloyl-ACP methyl ester carboxylesterase